MLNIKIHIDSVGGIVPSLVLLPRNKKVLDTAWAQNSGASVNDEIPKLLPPLYFQHS